VTGAPAGSVTAVHDTATCPAPATPAGFDTCAGNAPGVTLSLASDQAPLPIRLVARTRNTYAELFVRLDTVSLNDVSVAPRVTVVQSVADANLYCTA